MFRFCSFKVPDCGLGQGLFFRPFKISISLLKQSAGKDHLSTAQMGAQQSAGDEDAFKPEEVDSEA